MTDLKTCTQVLSKENQINLDCIAKNEPFCFDIWRAHCLKKIITNNNQK